ncbi:hypothetical protein [Streptomyces sp. NPDC048825]|uniref:hypothetical protein n=1 Tax=Streptomyces sp. NPDC048825 TaxID=3365592 RepID=UPI0037116A0B
MKNRGITAAFVAVAVFGGLTLGGCTTEDDGSTPAPTRETQTEERQTEEQGEELQGGREEPQRSERDDLLSFKIDDRSQAGFENIWVTWTIKNQSAEKSDYSWDWEAIASNGERVYNSTEYVTDVQPGQTTTGEFPTTLQTSNVKINITDFERTKSY